MCKKLLNDDSLISRFEDDACFYYSEEAVEKRHQAELRAMRGFREDRENLRKYLESKGVSSVGEFEEKYNCDYDDDPELDRLYTLYNGWISNFL